MFFFLPVGEEGVLWFVWIDDVMMHEDGAERVADVERKIALSSKGSVMPDVYILSSYLIIW